MSAGETKETVYGWAFPIQREVLSRTSSPFSDFSDDPPGGNLRAKIKSIGEEKAILASGVSMSLLPLLDNERKFMQAIQNITDTGSLRGISMQGISLRKPRRFFALILTTASSLTKGTLPLSLFNISWNKPSWKRSRFHRRNVSVHQVKF